MVVFSENLVLWIAKSVKIFLLFVDEILKIGLTSTELLNKIIER